MKRHRMVGWYDPVQLIRTGVNVVVSLLLKSRADYRVVEALSFEQNPFDYKSHPELWIDYVASEGFVARPTAVKQQTRPASRSSTRGANHAAPLALRRSAEGETLRSWIRMRWRSRPFQLGIRAITRDWL